MRPPEIAPGAMSTLKGLMPAVPMVHGNSRAQRREVQEEPGRTPDIDDRISRWLRAVLAETAGVEPRIEINVSHAAVDQNRRLIRSHRISELPMQAPEMYELVEEIAETITSDAQDLGGVQRPQVWLLLGESLDWRWGVLGAAALVATSSSHTPGRRPSSRVLPCPTFGAIS